MKLTRYENIYFINSKVLLKPSTINTSIISKAFEFAFEMAFEKGHHRKSRTGGTKERTSIEIFRNTLQGKIAEGVAFDTLAEHDIKCDPIDYNIHGKGIWDDTDLEYKDIKISIKSVAHFSNLL